MDKHEREVIQVTKEIVIKFIETQRISPSNFPELFPSIFKIVEQTLKLKTKSSDEDEKDAD